MLHSLASAKTRKHKAREHNGPACCVHANTRTREHANTRQLLHREHANTQTHRETRSRPTNPANTRTLRSSNTRTREHNANTAFTRTQAQRSFEHTPRFTLQSSCVHANRVHANTITCIRRTVFTRTQARLVFIEHCVHANTTFNVHRTVFNRR